MAKDKKTKKSKKSKIAKKTLVTLLLDRSYSMMARKSATLEAISSYMHELKENSQNVRFSLLQFDSHGGMTLEKTMEAVDIQEASPLRDEDYQPRGGTPLIEATITTINALTETVKGRDDIQVVVAIQTDGEENASGGDFTWDALRALIKEKEALGWQFNFMGAGIDAYQQGARMGISREKTISYSDDRVATRAAFAASAVNTAMYSTGLSADVSYDATQKAAAGDAFDGQSVKDPSAGGIVQDTLSDILGGDLSGVASPARPDPTRRNLVFAGTPAPGMMPQVGGIPGWSATSTTPDAAMVSKSSSKLTIEVGDDERSEW